MTSRRLVLLLGVPGLAALSLLLPFAPVYDPWAWLVWGRELAGLDLDTAHGPAWKPLPVLITTPIAALGDAAPQIWLFVARTAWLASVVLAWRLAAELVFPTRLSTSLAGWLAARRVRAARTAAGAIAAVGLILLFDPFTSWTRQFAGGLSESLAVALLLAGVERHLAARCGQAFAFAAACALIRPEVWPLLALYGLFLWSSEPRMRRRLIVGAVAVPALWLIPDLLGSGDALTGVSRAAETGGAPLIEAAEALGWALNLVLGGLWVAAGYAVYDARRHRERAIGVLAAGATLWIATVAGMAMLGFAGLPRFAAPGAALVCVLGGVGVVRMVAAVDGARSSTERRIALLAVVALLAGLGVQGAIRAATLPGDVDEAVQLGRDLEGLFELASELGPERVAACGSVTTSDFTTQPALAWRLELPLRSSRLLLEADRLESTVFLGPATSAAERRRVTAAARPLERNRRWSAYATSCAADGAPPSRSEAPPTPEPGRRAIAGVRGAVR